MTIPNDAQIAQRVAAEQLAWWRRNGVSAREASAGVGMCPTDDWARVERWIERAWRGAVEIIVDREADIAERRRAA